MEDEDGNLRCGGSDLRDERTGLEDAPSPSYSPEEGVEKNVKRVQRVRWKDYAENAKPVGKGYSGMKGTSRCVNAERSRDRWEAGPRCFRGQ